jgi:hypothetical protein
LALTVQILGAAKPMLHTQNTATGGERPTLFFNQLPDHFFANGLPRPSLAYLYKLNSQGEGPPTKMVWHNRLIVDPDEALAWYKARLDKYASDRLERSRRNQEATEKLLAKRAREAAAAREQRKSAVA